MAAGPMGPASNTDWLEPLGRSAPGSLTGLPAWDWRGDSASAVEAPQLVACARQT